MDQENQDITLAVLDSASSWIAESLDEDTVLTIIALISEDPTNWQEALSVWPRYRSSAVCESTGDLPMEQTDRASVLETIRTAESWVVIDFENKRLSTGGQFEAIDRDSEFLLDQADDSDFTGELYIHLPPWWDLQSGARFESLHEVRQTPIQRPMVDREILYGQAFLTFVASRALEVFHSDEWTKCAAGTAQRDRYALTVATHKDWLMTPRVDLGGRIPRQMLHGAIHWANEVTEGQRNRYESGGPMIAAPDDWQGYPTAPMGSQEMCTYFDFCRELIDAGWEWLESKQGTQAANRGESAVTELVEFLDQIKENWLNNPHEGGPSPNFVIECDRRRVPIGDGVQIEGIDAVATTSHQGDCDCPICALMADGMFGTSFSSIDGHHLELDDEFAFSMNESQEEWEEEQGSYQAYEATFKAQESDRKEAAQDDGITSAWTTIRDPRPIPGDPSGHLKMAFMVAEIVSVLEDRGNRQTEIKDLNKAFAVYRRAKPPEAKKAKKKFKRILERLAKSHPELVSRSADLQSHLDEAHRRPLPL
ncbi:MAG: hypothetical protein NTV29_02345 [Planctomycetota bacterium]|nr:hypothetical protein [Planctomycetota bacterium]